MTQEEIDITSVRMWAKSAHVDDAGGEKAFEEGRGVFDVTPHGAKLTKFFDEHPDLRSAARLDPSGFYPHMKALVNNRPVYFAFRRDRPAPTI